MLKKILLIILGYLLIAIPQSLAASIPVDQVFSDIGTDYKYYDELQTLYDRGMVFPDSEGRFNPLKLLNRDEFVGISLEVVCKKCIQPNTNFSFIEAYQGTTPFFDVLETNPYFYCIADADANDTVRGYDAGYVCEDGSSRANERPFCVNNKITLEEAIAVILRNSGIFSIADNQAVMNDILAGRITENIAEDVAPKNLDGSPYTFYGYLREALTYTLREVTPSGEEKVYQLLELKDGKIRPKKQVTKEEFLRIAYIALKANSCIEVSKNSLSLDFHIFDASCSEGSNCSESPLTSDQKIYDFGAQIQGFCSQGIDEPNGYIWRFINEQTGDEIKKYGKYLDNYEFLENGVWKVFLRVVDRCGNTAEVMHTMAIGDGVNGLDVSIEADPLIGYGPLFVDFEGISPEGTSYIWDFGDDTTGFGRSISHVYRIPGLYEVTLRVQDANNHFSDATVVINVLDTGIDTSGINLDGVQSFDANRDTDGDDVRDSDDICPDIPGEAINNGCPVFGDRCGSDCSCPRGYTCSTTDINNCSTVGICRPVSFATSIDSCLIGESKAIIYGNASCNQCPCNNFLDFLSAIRRCDYLFPAITSPDATEIYSRGDLYKVY